MTRQIESAPCYVVATLLFAAVFAVAAPVQAEDDLEIGLGAKGGVMFAGATEVPEETDYVGFDGQGDPELYGLFGAGGGVGPALDIRYRQIIGLESALYFTNDSTQGTNELQEPEGGQVGDITQHQSTTALHIPLLLKASIPSDNVRPVFGVGVEFVSQQSSNLDYTSDELDQETDERNEHNSTTPSNYTLLQFTAGVEIDAGPLRIPIELRAGYNLGWNDTFSDRVDVANTDPERFVYDGEYIGHLGIFAGVLYRWGIDL